MLRVLFDKNVPYPLKRHLTDCQVRTAEEEGWGQISNGDLISRAVRYQQNLTHRKISMVVLGSNIWQSVQQRVPEITLAVATVSPGSFEFIEIAPGDIEVNRSTAADRPDRSSSLKSLPRRSGAGCLVRRCDPATSVDYHDRATWRREPSATAPPGPRGAKLPLCQPSFRSARRPEGRRRGGSPNPTAERWRLLRAPRSTRAATCVHSAAR